MKKLTLKDFEVQSFVTSLKNGKQEVLNVAKGGSEPPFYGTCGGEHFCNPSDIPSGG